jgi:leucyl-tRNA synthetase
MRLASRFRLRDFVISRQRPWGTPIPTVTCEECGIVPLRVDELPVELPIQHRLWRDGGNPLADPSFASTRCPSCAGPARRESDTLDCHFDGIWLAIASCVRNGDRTEHLFDHLELRRWLPGRLLLWGADGGGYVFDQRMMVKALRDIGPLDYLSRGEIFDRASMHEMVHFEGQKMSKHLGNVVDPLALVETVGADAVRFAVLHAAAPRKVLQWSEETVAYAHNFVARSWNYAEPRLRALSDLPGLRIDPADSLRARLLRWCGAAVARTGHELEALETQRATRALIEFLDRIEDFERRVGETRHRLDDRDREAMATALLLYVRLLAPITPHLAEELWAAADRDGLVVEQPWPQPPAAGEPLVEADVAR